MDAAWQVCRKHLDGTIKSFRLGMEGQGGESLVHFVDTLMSILPKFPPEDILQVNAVLQEILQAQSAKDYLRVADLLEYGGLLPPAMEAGGGC